MELRARELKQLVMPTANKKNIIKTKSATRKLKGNEIKSAALGTRVFCAGDASTKEARKVVFGGNAGDTALREKKSLPHKCSGRTRRFLSSLFAGGIGKTISCNLQNFLKKSQKFL